MIGTVIHEQYQVLELMGEGGMGIVYKALDQELDRLVALKFLKAEFGDNQLLIKRFRDELKVLASFNHPNITMLYTSFTQQSRPVMVMELLDGEPLNRMIDRRGPIPANVCIPLVRQALAGVAEAHRRGIVHRDLKPANLMLNQGGIVKVMDFGIAKIESSPGLTKTTTAMGTPYYIAPEQIDPERFGLTRADARTDIYSMGVTLYELLAGEVPFKGATEYSIQRAHLEQAPEPPTIYYPHIPPGIVDAVLRAMAKDPANRFQKAEDFAEALAKVPLENPVITVAPAFNPPISGLTAQTPMQTLQSTAAGHSSAPAGLTATAVPGNSLPGRTQADPALTGQPATLQQTVPGGQTQPQIVARGKSPIAIVVIALAAVLLLSAGGVGLLIALRPTSTPLHNGGGSGGRGSLASGGDNGQFHLPPPVIPSGGDSGGSSSGGGDIPAPIIEPKPKPLPPPSEKTPAPVRPASPGIVSGLWSGRYTNYATNTVTSATVNLSERSGSDPNNLYVTGMLTLQGAGGVQRCPVVGNLDKRRNKLTYRATACSVGAVPAYLSAHTTVLTPSSRLMSGTVDPDMGVVVTFNR
jgi:serine/threonine protein kinase